MTTTASSNRRPEERIVPDMTETAESSNRNRPQSGSTRVPSSQSSSTTASSSPSVFVNLVILILLGLVHTVSCVHFDEHTNHIYPVKDGKRMHQTQMQVFYQTGKSELDLPVCSPHSVCNKVDTYGTPWVEKQCRCPIGTRPCSTAGHAKDGHTISDRNRLYKTCEPVHKLKRCQFFHDITWTLVSYPDNSTQQIMHCRCPRNAVAYLVKRNAFQTDQGISIQYSFACSPQTKLRCQRKEPCRLFSVRSSSRSPLAEEANTSTLCQCPHRRKCPKHHLDVGVIPAKTYADDDTRTYTGYCM